MIGILQGVEKVMKLLTARGLGTVHFEEQLSQVFLLIARPLAVHAHKLVVDFRHGQRFPKTLLSCSPVVDLILNVARFQIEINRCESM